MTRKQEGYTLLSMMLALSALVIFSILFASIVISLRDHSQKYLFNDEVILFTEQLKIELHGATNVTWNQDTLSFYTQQNVITYAFSQHQIIRQKNSAGYEIVLQNVGGFSCEKLYQGLRVEVSSINGSQFEAWINVFPQESVL